ncbi:hypothetical protein, partial [Klebsiella pneumoniae]|uniref:hypothetical protein n=1 Tax=Klebsiella pneumoniae TaxID=573 RepID=UPI002731BA94
MKRTSIKKNKSPVIKKKKNRHTPQKKTTKTKKTNRKKKNTIEKIKKIHILIFQRLYVQHLHKKQKQPQKYPHLLNKYIQCNLTK